MSLYLSKTGHTDKRNAGHVKRPYRDAVRKIKAVGNNPFSSTSKLQRNGRRGRAVVLQDDYGLKKVQETHPPTAMYGAYLDPGSNKVLKI